MDLTWRVDELAQRKGWNARLLARKAGLDVKIVRNILNGRATRVDLETIRRLVEALGVEPGALWRRTTNEGKNRWAATAGAAGAASRHEIHETLRGDWNEGRDDGQGRV